MHRNTRRIRARLYGPCFSERSIADFLGQKATHASLRQHASDERGGGGSVVALERGKNKVWQGVRYHPQITL